MRTILLVTSILIALHARCQADDELAARAYEILQSRCYRCHGGSGRAADLNVLNGDDLFGVRGQGEETYQFIIAGKPEESQLWDAVDSGYMPDEGSPEARAMTDEERQVLKDWITAGAEFPKLRDVQFRDDKETLRSIRDYLYAAPADDRQYLRFFTLNHIYNDAQVSEKDLRKYRAALSMVVNSLSLERKLEIPREVPGSNGTVYVIDIRNVRWDKFNRWELILSFYPYGLRFDYVRDEEFRQIAQDVHLLSGSPVPHVRADWFVVTAAQPPLYHDLLEIPDQLAVLERQLDIDRFQNFLHDDLDRSGFAKSNVSQQNRMLERHDSRNTPYFWISYDFKPRKARGDLVRFPLGPVFNGNPFIKQAFDHDGGELLWSLPNGLQGYMLVNAAGGRIDRGPVDVVFDKSPVLGTPEIINGISCMMCHRQGMIAGFRDEIRDAGAVGGDVQKKVEELHPPAEVMNGLVEHDRRLFLSALEQTLGPFLQVDEDKDAPLTSFPQPIAYVADYYTQDLTAERVAYELGLENLEALQLMINSNRELLKLGLGSLTENPPGTLKREKWETIEGTSLMQDVALELRLGTPFRRSQ